MCNTTRSIDAGRTAICPCCLSYSSDRAGPLQQSHSAKTEFVFADLFMSISINISEAVLQGPVK